MDSSVETILSIIPGQSETDRLLLVLVQEFGAGSTIQLQQQTWGEGVGWFTQTTIPMTPEQVSQLRQSLGSAPSRPVNPISTLSRSVRNGEALPFRLVQAESA